MSSSDAIRRQSEYGIHSLRGTFATMPFRASGNIGAIQILLGHSKIENAFCYLGIYVEGALNALKSEAIISRVAG